MKYVLYEVRNFSTNTIRVLEIRKWAEKFLWVVFSEKGLAEFKRIIQNMVINTNANNPDKPPIVFECASCGKNDTIRISEGLGREFVIILHLLKGEYVVEKKNK
jgi:hypothetical protein